MRLHRLMLALALLTVLTDCRGSEVATCTAPVPIPVERGADGSYSQHPYVPPDCQH